MVAGFQSQFPPICDWNPPTVPPRKIGALPHPTGSTKKTKTKFSCRTKIKAEKQKEKRKTSSLNGVNTPQK